MHSQKDEIQVPPDLARPETERAVLATAVQSAAVANVLAEVGESIFTSAPRRKLARVITDIVSNQEDISPDLVEAILGEPLNLDTLPLADDRALAGIRILTDFRWYGFVNELVQLGRAGIADPTDKGLRQQIYSGFHSLERPPGNGGLVDLDDFEPSRLVAEKVRRLWSPTGVRALDEFLKWLGKDGKYYIGGIPVGTLIMIAAESGGYKSRTMVELMIRMAINWHLKFGYLPLIQIASGEMGAVELLNAAGANPRQPRQRHTRGFEQLGVPNPLRILSKEDFGSADIDGVLGIFAEQTERRVHQGRARGLSRPEIVATLPRLVGVDYGDLFLPSGMARWEGLKYTYRRMKEYALKAPFDMKRYPELEDWAPIVFSPAQIKGAAELMKRGEYHRPDRYSLRGSLDIIDEVDMAIFIGRRPADMPDNPDSPFRELIIDKNRLGQPCPHGLQVAYYRGQMVERPDVLNPETGQPAELGRPYLGPGPLEVS